MRILFATYSLAFQNPGGGERVLLALKDALQKSGEEVVLYDPWKHDPASFDIIHFFSTVERTAWGALKRLAPKAPLCVTPVLYFPPGVSGRLQKWKLQLSDRIPFLLEGNTFAISDLKIPDFFFPTTESEGEELKELGVAPEKIQSLPNGVGPQFLTSDDGTLFRKRFGIQGPFVLHVGRFHPVKNHLALFKAVAQLKCQCVCIGNPDADQKEYFDTVAKEAAAIGVRLLPALGNEDPLLASAYAAASVAVLPSLFETFGITILEAAIAGTPVVFSNTCQNKKEFEKFGVTVSPKDISAIAASIEQALRSPRLPMDFRKALFERYGWDGVGRLLLKQYQLLVAKAPRN